MSYVFSFLVLIKKKIPKNYNRVSCILEIYRFVWDAVRNMTEDERKKKRRKKEEITKEIKQGESLS